GRDIIENCDIYANTYPGISIENGGNPTICRCKIHDGQSNGIWVYDKGQGTIEDCNIFANAESGIYISKEGNPTICRSKIHDGQGNGIIVNDKGQGIIKDCEIFANANLGICVTKKSSIQVHNCNAFNNKDRDWHVDNDCTLDESREEKENKNLKNNTIPDNESSAKSKKESKPESKQPASNKTVKSNGSRLDLLLNQLESMIGLDSVKEAVLEIVNTEIANQRLKKAGYEVEESETRHMLFAGNPGTGKTTIARLIGEIFKEIGILQKGEFIEVQRNSLVAIYLGQTASKTTELVESALDSVLFIDEAYSLANGRHDEYGREAITTLIALMENYRHRLVMIFAGYSKEMEVFLDSNPGLKSRIAFHIDFPDYTGEEMHSIFLTMCNNTKPGWHCPENVSERLRSIFINMYENRGYNFANGRDVRNIFEKMVRRIKSRIVKENLSGQSMRTFSLNDIPPEIQ
ncbi:MAG: right-handed parallel beta-helix repeat-containing protein, partial [Rhizonema sp. NSF051]|nr:right-handed parallel beta-helix repeat-containing protein [Rhizonema sp. NSF051]